MINYSVFPKSKMPVQNLIELKNKIKIANWTSKFGLIYTKEEEMKKNIE